MLREDSSLVGPCEETRAGAERQTHPSADEVVHGRLDCGAIKRSGLKTPDQQPRCPADLQAFPVTDSAGRGLVDNRYAAVNVTQASTAASPLFLSGPPPSSPLYLANAAISCSSSSSTCLSQPPAAALPSDG